MCDTCPDASRRQFLQTAMVGAAGAVLLPAWALASDGHGAPKGKAMAKPGKSAEPPAEAHASPSGASLTPDEALARLLEGNRRFVANKSFHPNETPEAREKLAKGQNPFAVILGCADSRVPPEVVFDFGLGDLFVIRVAGNIVEDAGVGSIEYAIDHLGTPLIVVLGHERCGAVSATIQTLDEGGEAPGQIAELVRKIKPAVEAVTKVPGDRVDNAVRENARRMAAEIAGLEPILKEKVDAGKLKVVAARYDLDSGVVEIL
ncbi:MAG: carbonic anhydrase [Fibrobacteria bacterium]|nr:carbonic anhydrase [Fibrobacteria bacterium]